MQNLAQNGYSYDEVVEVLTGKNSIREWTFRYELLDSLNRYVGTLKDVVDCRVSQNALADVKRTAKMTVKDDPSVDWLNVRVKPWARLRMPLDARQLTQVIETIPAKNVWWRLNGPEATDSSGNNRDATTSTGVLFEQPSILGTGQKSVELGSGDDLKIANGNATPVGGRVSVMFFISGVGNETPGQSVFDNILVGEATPDPDYAIKVTMGTLPIRGAIPFRNRAIRVEVSTGSGICVFETGSDAYVQGNVTSHIAFSWSSGGGIVIYVNGERVPTVYSENPTVTGTVGYGFPGWHLGSGNTRWYSEVVVADTVFNPATVREVYQAGMVTGKFGPANYVEWPQGVFIPITPNRHIGSGSTVTRDVDLYDPLLQYDDDKVSARYTVTAGTNYITKIVELLGASTPQLVTASSKTLPAAKEWEPGTSKLSIINDLLGALNYEALWFDETGRAICAPYVAPGDMPVEWRYATDQSSVIMPGVDHTLDLFNVPNKWVLTVSEADRAILTATYTNSNVNSPTSTVNRGRTIVDYRTETEAADQATLNAKVLRLAQEASQVYESVEFDTGIMPFHGHRDSLEIAYPALGVTDFYNEQTWEMDMKAGGTMSHRVRKVVIL